MPEERTIIRSAVEHGFRTVSGGIQSDGTKALAVSTLREQRDKEKSQLANLNDRFASYIQRVKFLESHNKQLQVEMEELRAQWGLDAERIRREFEPGLQSTRDQLDAITSDKAVVEIQTKRAEYDAHTYRQLCDDLAGWISIDRSKIENLTFTLRENEEEFLVLRSQIEDADADLAKQKAQLDNIYEELHRMLHELDQETLQRIQLENEKQTLEEQIPFMNALHEQEMSELKSLSSGHHVDPTSFYRAELQRAIKEIRSDFDALSVSQRHELEEYYRVKTEECRRMEAEEVQRQARPQTNESEMISLRSSISDNRKELAQLQTECGQLTSVLSQLESELEQARRLNSGSLEDREREIIELRNRLSQLIANYDEIVANKTSLEFEINTYRRLLEGEEAHASKSSERSKYEFSTRGSAMGGDGVANGDIVSATTTFSTGSIGKSTVIPTRITQTEMQAKTTYQRNAKGPVSISECSPDGKYITLDNTSKNKDIDLSGWKLFRKVDSGTDIHYLFPSGYRLNSSRNLRIWSRAGAISGQVGLNDLTNNAVETWGVGMNVVTKLYNEQGEEKATHVQRTVYAS